MCACVRLYLCMCLGSFVNVCTDWCVLARVCVCAGSPGCGLITAASLTVHSRPPGAHLPPSILHLPPLSCSKHPRLTSGRSCFPPLLLFSYNRVTKAQNTDMAARQRRELLQKNALWPNERHLRCFLKSLRRLFSWTTELMLKTMQYEVSSVVCLLRT